MAARRSNASAVIVLVIGVKTGDKSNEGGAKNHFRLGGACARELTPWVSRGRGILRRGALGRGKFCGAGWVLVRSYFVRRPCFPFVVGLLHSGPNAPRWARGSTLAPSVRSPTRCPAALRKGL